MPREQERQETWHVDGHELTVTHLDKVLWPDDGMTKRDVLAYYRTIAPVLLPYLRNHPVVLRLFPDGITGQGFYLRNAPESMPAWIRTAHYHPVTEEAERVVPLIDDAAGLLWFVNRGALEVHVWAAPADRPEFPDWVVFDLDPGPRAGFDRVIEAALVLRQRLASLGVPALPKTSGGSGLHLWAPIEPRYHVDMLRTWVAYLAEELSREYATLFAPPDGATHDEDERITLDAAQNSVARNTAAPYTLRARPGAPVSTPLTWEEVEGGQIRPEQFTWQAVLQRVHDRGDVWQKDWKPGKLPIDGTIQSARRRARRREHRQT